MAKGEKTFATVKGMAQALGVSTSTLYKARKDQTEIGIVGGYWREEWQPGFRRVIWTPRGSAHL